MVARKKKARLETTLIEGVQQIWLAGMGAIARAQKEGPSAFQDAVAEGLKLLGKSRTQAEKMVREAFESAQDTVQTRLDSARDQANETWDNLESLFQSRVHKALQQIGVPSAEEVRLLAKRVAELNASVQSLSAKPKRGRARAVKRAPARRRRGPARAKAARTR
ncbi:MAG: poly granule associated protein [Gammaproteobacteria bacterium]|nr:poly granule associated protein [Gammaproteobacteria bacterium]